MSDPDKSGVMEPVRDAERGPNCFFWLGVMIVCAALWYVALKLVAKHL